MSGMNKHLLLLSKHFPPSEEAGALRWQKFASLAGELGYHIGWQWLESLAERDEASVSETGKRRVADPLREAS